MAVLSSKKSYKWTFENIGGAPRVQITTGEDIAHLDELDPKMWTVLSCPVKGLEIDEKSLTLIDIDGDGKIRVNDIITTSKWVLTPLSNTNDILRGDSSIDLGQFNPSDPIGKELITSGEFILKSIGKEGEMVLSLKDVEDARAIVSKNIPAPEGGSDDGEYKAPFGDSTDKVVELYDALDAKVKDYFLRSKLAAFSPDSLTALDVKKSDIEAISGGNLIDKNSEIASYPLARITGSATLDLNGPINPSWSAKFEEFKKLALLSESGEKTTLTEEDWNQIGAALNTYKEFKAGKLKVLEESKANIDASIKGQLDSIALMERYLYIYKDFYKLLKNFVTLHDFYDKTPDTKAIFQSGRLIIDQRECFFCMKVQDVAKHSAAAPQSGMYLVYCDCTTKNSAAKVQIVAAVTVGDVGDLVVGKNAVYYDNAGVEWDAVIIKIVENPISLGQAFWSPYRRIAKTVEGFIAKNAADKDAKMMKDVTAKINTAPPAGQQLDPKAAMPFDIGKFAGIFAALGMAVGMIGTALASIFKEIVALTWWQLLLTFVGCLLVVSGPAMVMAWMKLRKRNIAPLLNANGWAVNAASRISIPFGATLTQMAQFPKLNLRDPYAKKGIPTWKKWVISITFLIIVLAIVWLVNGFEWIDLPSPLPYFNSPADVVEGVEAVDAIVE